MVNVFLILMMRGLADYAAEGETNSISTRSASIIVFAFAIFGYYINSTAGSAGWSYFSSGSTLAVAEVNVFETLNLAACKFLSV